MGVVWNSGRDLKKRRSWGEKRSKVIARGSSGLIEDNRVVLSRHNQMAMKIVERLWSGRQ